MECVALILAGGGEERFGPLAARRAVVALPFGGCYRVIDFTLSNCVNSGITDIGVLAQVGASTLRRHIGRGRPWDLDRRAGGIRILQPYLHRKRGEWYRGTADALAQNLDYIEDSRARYFLVLCGDGVYKMNYRQLLAFHGAARAEVTLAVKTVRAEEAPQYGIVEVVERDRVVGFEEKPEEPRSRLAFLGIYLFSRAVLLDGLAEVERSGSNFDLVRDLIPLLIRRERVFAYRFDDFWEDVGTIPRYYRAHMDLLRPDAGLNLLDPVWPIHTHGLQLLPAKLLKGSAMTNSFVAEGCVVGGEVRDSVLYTGARVERGAVVRDSILMSGSRVKAGASVRRAILDEDVTVASGRHVAPETDGDVAVVCD